MSETLARLFACFAAHIGRLAATSLVPLLFLIGTASPGFSAELLLFERSGCVWCARWDREIGPIYPKTEEAKRAPLRRISLDKPLPEGLRLETTVFYTPSFVLMEAGREIGRITGYAGEDAFWGLLTTLINRLEAGKPSAN